MSIYQVLPQTDFSAWCPTCEDNYRLCTGEIHKKGALAFRYKTYNLEKDETREVEILLGCFRENQGRPVGYKQLGIWFKYLENGEPGLMFIHPEETRIGVDPTMGRVLSRDSAMADPDHEDFMEMANLILLDDPRINAFVTS